MPWRDSTIIKPSNNHKQHQTSPKHRRRCTQRFYNLKSHWTLNPLNVELWTLNFELWTSNVEPSLIPFSLRSKAWSCRESNPGPNKKRGCFLHAYSVFDCREKHGDGHPNSTLSPKISPPHRRIEATSPVFFAIALPKRNQTVQSSDVSFQHLVPELR